MRMLQTLVYKLLSFLVLLLGLLLLAELWTDVFPLIFDRTVTTFQEWSPWLQKLVWVAGGILLVLVGIVGLLPPLRRRRGRQISFAGPHGDVSIQLDSVEATLNRVVSKMPEVNKIHARVVPVDENRKVEIAADVVLNKLPAVGAREIARRVSNQLRNTAVHILGVDEVTSIKLDVSRIVVDLKKPMEIPEETAAPAQAGLGASPVGMGPVTTIEGVEEAEEEMLAEAARTQEQRFEPPASESAEAAPLEPAETPLDEPTPAEATDDVEADRTAGLGLIDDEPASSTATPESDREETAEAQDAYGVPLSQEPVESGDTASSSSPWEEPFRAEDRPFDAERDTFQVDEPLPAVDEPAEEAQVTYLPEDEEEPLLTSDRDEAELPPPAEEEPLLPQPERLDEDDRDRDSEQPGPR